MLHLGLTGNIASGKSAVAVLLARHGAMIIDSDVLAREAVARGTPGLAAVVGRFGDHVLSPDGTLDRAALRRRVFANPIERDALNAIVHPEVGRLRERRLTAARERGDNIVVSDIPLLFEVGLEHAFDGIVFVDAPEGVRLERLMRDRGLPRDEADAMLRAQDAPEEKRSRATWVIDNDGSREQLAGRVTGLWQTLAKLAAERAASPRSARS
ncbi:MAG: dephospho-CoA kinase [Gemmatimonas sp.]